MKRNDSRLTAFLLCMGVSLVSPNYLYGKGEVAMNIMQQSQKNHRKGSGLQWGTYYRSHYQDCRYE